MPASRKNFLVNVLGIMIFFLLFHEKCKETLKMSSTQEWKCFMDVRLEKSPFRPELTQILDLEEAEIHYGKTSIMAHSQHFK